MKSIIRILTICLVALSLTACLKSKYDPSLSIGEQIKTEHFEGHPDTFGKNQLLEEIFECIDTGDVDRMKELFSDYALANNSDLDNEIQNFYDQYPQVNEVKNRCTAVSGGHNRGSTEYEYKYQIMADLYDTDGNKYHFIIEWIEGYTDDRSMQGLHSIQIISQEAYDNHHFDIHVWGDRPGVYVYYEDEK